MQQGLGQKMRSMIFPALAASAGLTTFGGGCQTFRKIPEKETALNPAPAPLITFSTPGIQLLEVETHRFSESGSFRVSCNDLIKAPRLHCERLSGGSLVHDFPLNSDVRLEPGFWKLKVTGHSKVTGNEVSSAPRYAGVLGYEILKLEFRMNADGKGPSGWVPDRSTSATEINLGKFDLWFFPPTDSDTAPQRVTITRPAGVAFSPFYPAKEGSVMAVGMINGRIAVSYYTRFSSRP